MKSFESWRLHWLLTVVAVLLPTSFSSPLNSSYRPRLCDTRNPLMIYSKIMNKAIIRAGLCDVPVNYEELKEKPEVILSEYESNGSERFTLFLLKNNMSTGRYKIQWMIVNIQEMDHSLTSGPNKEVLIDYTPPSYIPANYTIIVYRQNRRLPLRQRPISNTEDFDPDDWAIPSGPNGTEEFSKVTFFTIGRNVSNHTIADVHHQHNPSNTNQQYNHPYPSSTPPQHTVTHHHLPTTISQPAVGPHLDPIINTTLSTNNTHFQQNITQYTHNSVVSTQNNNRTQNLTVNSTEPTTKPHHRNAGMNILSNLELMLLPIFVSILGYLH